MKYYILSCLTAVIILGACNTSTEQQEQSAAVLKVENPLDMERADVIVSLDLESLANLKGEGDGEYLQIPHQYIDENNDGTDDQVLLLLEQVPANNLSMQAQDLFGSSALEIAPRTQAEISHKINGEWKEREYIGGRFVNVDHLKVPPEHTDHSWYIRYEGPGWESDKVGYRFYLDWRNATDIFGKKTTDLVLQDVGQDGFDSYHEPADWGMDVLKVGNSLGIGSIGMWVDGKAERVAVTDSLESEIDQNGPIRASVLTTYHGWQINDQKLDLISELSIDAGSRLSHHQVAISEAVPNLCTGIVKLEDTETITSNNSDSEWQYFATYGKQSLAEDQLGMAIFYKKGDLMEITEDEFSHVLVLNSSGNSLSYYFAAAWEQEPEGITNKEDFVTYLEQTISELDNPVSINTK